MKFFLIIWILSSALAVTSFFGSRRKQKAEERFINFCFSDTTGWAIGSVKTGGWANDSSKTLKNVYRTMILKSTDGGQHWLLQTVVQTGDEPTEVRAMFVLDRTHAWAVMSQPNADKDFIITTSDGKSWRAFSFKQEIVPRKICFSDSLNGWIIGSDAIRMDQIYRTTDGGKTWAPYSIGYNGAFHDIKWQGKTGYILANVDRSDHLSILRTKDGGNIWIIAATIKADSGQSLVGTSLQIQGGSVYALGKTSHEDEGGNSVWIYSTDGFITFAKTTVNYEKESKQSDCVLGGFSVRDSLAIGVDQLQADFISEDERSYNLIVTNNLGKSWQTVMEFKSEVRNVVLTKKRLVVLSNSEGEILISENDGLAWRTADIDFRNVFRIAAPSLMAGSTAGNEFFEADWDDSDTTYGTKWESVEDSLRAVNLTRTMSLTKYKPDSTKAFAVGIDSINSTAIQFDKRVRRGAKPGNLDLIKEEALLGEIKVRKYKTVRFVGRFRSQKGRQPLRYSWSSSIDGELSNQLKFTTHPRQLHVGTHYIFFKAMDESGQWSEPMITKVVVEDFPKYKFPFLGTWTAGGGGSYYNKGHHIRGIKYALDLNYVESNEGGEGDYGLPVRASLDGVVSFAGYARGYGRMVKIDYVYAGHKYTSLVSHLATISVEVGERVRQGQEVGTCGTTGRSSAPHVHWELRMDDICVPPEPIFENDSTIVQMVNNGESFDSDNFYSPENIVVVDEGDIPNTWKERRGYNHSYRTASCSKNLKTVEAVWKPKLPRSGQYKVQVNIPKKFATGMATYRLHSKEGVKEIKVNQNKYTDEWVTLGIFDLDSTDDVSITLDNVTGQSKGTIAFDAVRFIGQWVNEATMGNKQ